MLFDKFSMQCHSKARRGGQSRPRPSLTDALRTLRASRSVPHSGGPLFIFYTVFDCIFSMFRYADIYHWVNNGLRYPVQGRAVQGCSLGAEAVPQSLSVQQARHLSVCKYTLPSITFLRRQRVLKQVVIVLVNLCVEVTWVCRWTGMCVCVCKLELYI